MNSIAKIIRIRFNVPKSIKITSVFCANFGKGFAIPIGKHYCHIVKGCNKCNSVICAMCTNIKQNKCIICTCEKQYYHICECGYPKMNYMCYKCGEILNNVCPCTEYKYFDYDYANKYYQCRRCENCIS